MNKSGLSLRIDLPDGSRFGPGKATLLRTLQHTGSIKSAANSLGMSYPRALKLIEQMNSAFADPVVETRHGGAEGGGTQLTDSGREILTLYEKICSDASDVNRDAIIQMKTYLSE